jgi:hypothetical protein
MTTTEPDQLERDRELLPRFGLFDLPHQLTPLNVGRLVSAFLCGKINDIPDVDRENTPIHYHVAKIAFADACTQDTEEIDSKPTLAQNVTDEKKSRQLFVQRKLFPEAFKHLDDSGELPQRQKSQYARLLKRIADLANQRETWSSQGSCNGMNPNIFVPPPVPWNVPEDVHKMAQTAHDFAVSSAKAVCASCPVKKACHDYGVRLMKTASRSEPPAIYGGELLGPSTPIKKKVKNKIPK